MVLKERFTFRDLLREPGRVSDAVDRNRWVHVSRRDGPDLVVLRSDWFESSFAGAGAIARLLQASPLSAQPDREHLEASFPWTRYLSSEACADFIAELVSTLEICEQLDTFAPLGQLMTEWKATAAIQADPELAAQLAGPVEVADGRPVPEP
jgi:hypothetical protein